MKLLFWIENAEGELFRQAGMRLGQIYGGLEVEAYTSRSNVSSCMANSKELRFVEKAAAKDETFDVLLVVGKDLQREKIPQQCRDLGLDDSKIVFDFEACMPGFSLERSNRLHRSRTSVFSINSWGRKICERFQLPFLSPFVDSTMTTEDYLFFLEAPREHLARELVFKETLGTADGREFPVFSMGKEGPKVYMLYETDAAKAGQQWKERVQRINWQDLLLVMYTESPDVLDRFDRLPYGKKVCFTSFESRLGSAFYLPAEQDEEGEDLPLWASVEKLAETEKPYYDLWDLLLYGRRTLIRYA